MLILREASESEQSSALVSGRSCWLSANHLMKITVSVICIVTNIQFGLSKGHGVLRYEITKLCSGFLHPEASTLGRKIGFNFQNCRWRQFSL